MGSAPRPSLAHRDRGVRVISVGLSARRSRNEHNNGVYLRPVSTTKFLYNSEALCLVYKGYKTSWIFLPVYKLSLSVAASLRRHWQKKCRNCRGNP